MSFILDALRKSEARRNKGEVPGLESGSAPMTRSSRRRLGLAAVLVLPLCFVVIAGAVLLFRPQWLPQGMMNIVDRSAPSPTPQVAVVPDVAEDEDDPTEVDRQALVQVEPIEQTTPQAEDDGDVDERPDESTAEPTVDRRRVVQPATGQTVSRPAPERERVVTDADEAMAEIERQVAESRAGDESEAERRRIADTPIADREREQRARREARPQEHPEESAQPEWRTQTAEYVRTWELPLSVRRNLPELNLSIHVFSADEAGRFVLINGERYVPGDQLSGGARLVDIRREGAIVDFREHRFLLEP